jgi:transcriptional regulator with XRE-family HTH domain
VTEQRQPDTDKPRRRRRPVSTVQVFDGNPHRLDMVAIESAFFRKVIEGTYGCREDMAKAAGCSRSTVSRFFAGKNVSIRVVLAILAELDLRFDDVAEPLYPNEHPASRPRGD